MQKRLQEIRDHLREDIEKVYEPKLKAMFETPAEVLWLDQGISRLRAKERKRVAPVTAGKTARPIWREHTPCPLRSCSDGHGDAAFARPAPISLDLER
jgi:hypothetical protein